MVRNMWTLCKPGGRVCGMGSSPFLTPDKLKKEEKYNRFFMVNDETYYKQNASRYLVRMIDEEADQDLNVVLNWFHPDFYQSTFE